MNTKRLFILLIWIGCLNFCYGYFPLLNNTSWEIFIEDFSGNSYITLTPIKDTTIGTFKYVKYIHPVTKLDVLLREDTATKKVYKRTNNIDKLLYDFSLVKGDKIKLDNGNTYTVTSITNINVIGGTRKKIILNSGLLLEEWIEGVGNERNPLDRFFELFTDPVLSLNCSFNNKINVYNISIALGINNPSKCSLTTETEIFSLNSIVTITPNPFYDMLKITSNTPFENASFKLLNAVGQVVKVYNGIEGNSYYIERDNLESGLYFLTIIERDKLLKNIKIVVSPKD